MTTTLLVILVVIVLLTMASVASVHTKLDTIAKETQNTMSALDDKISALQTAVANETTVNQSAITLIQGFGQRLSDAIAAALAAGATDAELSALNDLQTTLGTNADALAAAVAANTPAPTP